MDQVFPARAGMSLESEAEMRINKGFPRPRGDEPQLPLTGAPWFSFSPPARG